MRARSTLRGRLGGMALLRAWSKTRTFCPVCDAPLDASQSASEQTRCPACEHALIPVRVVASWRRAAAGLADFGVLLGTAGLLNLALLAIVGPPSLFGDDRGFAALLRFLEADPGAVLARTAPFLLMSAVYFGLFWSTTGRTPGARWLRIRVIDRHGRPPHPAWAGVRVVSHFFGAALGLLGWWWALFDLERRAWHDHLARTYVVKDA